jgi:hypothetical protein
MAESRHVECRTPGRSKALKSRNGCQILDRGVVLPRLEIGGIGPDQWQESNGCREALRLALVVKALKVEKPTSGSGLK